MIKDLSEDQIREFIKLYDYKIPYIKEYKYYLELQSKVDGSLLDKLDNFLLSWEKYLQSGKTSYKKYKLALIDQCIEQCNRISENIKQMPLIEDGLSLKDNKYVNGTYISIDLVEANHNAFFDMVLDGNLDEIPSFEVYFSEDLNYDAALINAKSVRQFIYGNLNPKRQIRHERRSIKRIIELIDTYIESKEYHGKLEIFNINSDEVVLKFSDELFEGEDVQIYFDLKDYLLNNSLEKQITVPFRVEMITYDIVSNCFDENVTIKYNVTRDKKSLFAVEGNRYFLYFKFLLDESRELCDKDLYFQVDGKLAKWVL